MSLRGAWALLPPLLLTAAAALALRLPSLDQRPLHNDEAVNAVKVTELWQDGRYAYDPDEYHGPTLHYATLPFLWLSGADDADELQDRVLRLAPVVFGIALIFLLPLFADGLGRAAVCWAALFIAVSPAMVFYSRYFIHEILLVFFTALTLGAGWRYFQNPSAAWAALAGTGLGLMFATKETFVLAVAAMGAAIVVSAGKELPRGSRARVLRKLWNRTHAGVALGAGILVWLLFFSSFFTHFQGLPDSIRTYLPWLERAGGESPHIHPWHFYLERLAWFHPAKSPVWSEGLILGLAIVGGARAWTRHGGALTRFLSVYTLALTAIYCVIPYKTPWCLLGFYHGMILMAGLGAATLVECVRPRGIQLGLGAVLMALTAHLGWQAVRANFDYAADRRNPYAYAQTALDLVRLMDRVEGLGRVAESGKDTLVKVIAPDSDYWPMPWYLRRFTKVGWYDRLPEDPFAPIVIVSSKFESRLDDRSDRKWIMAGITELRPGIFFELYVELELWKAFVETLPRNIEEG